MKLQKSKVIASYRKLPEVQFEVLSLRPGWIQHFLARVNRETSIRRVMTSTEKKRGRWITVRLRGIRRLIRQRMPMGATCHVHIHINAEVELQKLSHEKLDE